MFHGAVQSTLMYANLCLRSQVKHHMVATSGRELERSQRLHIRTNRSNMKVNTVALLLAFIALLSTGVCKRGIQLSKTPNKSLSAPDGLNFLVIGDWGGQPKSPYYTPAESAIAKVMGNKATEIGSQFTLALGDNFYDLGVKNVDDSRFKETFEVRLESSLV